MLLALALLFPPLHAQTNHYADACYRSAVAAGACCGRAECNNKEISEQHGDLLNRQKVARKELGDQGSSAGAGRLAELSTAGANVQSAMAVACRSRVETCFKQCDNAIKLAGSEGLEKLQERRSFCERFGEMGNQLSQQAEVSRQNAGAFGANARGSAADD